MFSATGLTGWQRNRGADPGTAPQGPSVQAADADVGNLRRQAADLEQALGALKSRIQSIEASALGQAPEEKDSR